GYHTRFPYARLARREPADGAPVVPGAPVETFPGESGPFSLNDAVAYSVINPAAVDAPYSAEITIPAPQICRIRFVDPDGLPVRGATVLGLTTVFVLSVILDGDTADVLGLSPGEPRKLIALSADGRFSVDTTIRPSSTQPMEI